MLISKGSAPLYCVLLISVFTSPALFAQPANAPWVGETFWGTTCFGREPGYGPYDYLLRQQYPTELGLVEGAHFTSNVENLVSGKKSKDPMPDLDYTLRAWPNHHRALNSVIRLRIRYGDNFPRQTIVPAECYLQRALNFSPKDANTHMLYAMLLQRMNYSDKAYDSHKAAEELDSDNVQVMYNLGLLLCDMGKFQEAKKYSDEVYARGFPLPGLKRRLERNGVQ